jgi:DNA replication protein DnaC
VEPIKNILAQTNLEMGGTPANHSPENQSTSTPANHFDEAMDVCPICRGAGVVHPLNEAGKPQYDRVVPCQCSRERIARERHEHMMTRCQLPNATADWTFENFDSSGPLKEAYDLALELAEERGEVKWLTLVGPVDVGKSHLAVAICRRWIDRGQAARYVLVPLMLEELRASYNREGEYDRLMDFLLKVPLLVLDDLGTQKPTEWAIEKLMQIVDYRYVNGLHMVVTTNRSPNEFPGDIYHRIGSRILRARFSRVVHIDAQEYRLRKRV